MGLFSWFNHLFSGSGSNAGSDTQNCVPGVNPATGLPMTDCSNTLDVAGNPYGVDLQHHDAAPIGEDHCAPSVNPATGFPMIDCSGIDVAGNPFGTDIYQPDTISTTDSFSSSSAFDDTWSSPSISDDPWSSSSSSWD